jgi:hypothetical protein
MPDSDPSSPSPDSPRPGWKTLPAGHIPRATYFPAGLAMGTVFLFWGFITSWVICAVGLALFAAALAGWFTEIHHERKH